MKGEAKYYTDPFVDVLFNILIGLTLLFFIALNNISLDSKRGDVESKAEYILTVTWPNQLTDDVDVWVSDPSGNIVSYVSESSGWLHLDRDDRGKINDVVMVDGQEIIYPINQEIVTIRKIIEGEYVVNLFYYRSSSQQPVSVNVRIDKINPALRTVFVDKVYLKEQGQELTVVRFSLTKSGEVKNINRLQKKITPY